ncbi:hypothetical protein CQZ91_29075 [Bacillus cereus]|uniref:hypothetical protein n=1 Tax=Bacillus cereus group TaxID=86661 RepID=UPI000CFD325E|nr:MULTISPECIES: hypothetical protein [Bacillus cereus group]PRC95325.1 hypothetical protein CQZ92_29325 [Bacillus cereus]PRC99872.1 hypothetical protein CQZ91_29075 [Bacillus cereus]HDR6295699.1 hypothetical protein [Bacillus cereus]HDR7806986.1 hypothetical protein [Bacillus cereus]
MKNYYFSIEKATKDSGNYIVYECKDGQREQVFERSQENAYGGLKESRQAIGSYLQQCGYGLKDVFTHYCVIHDDPDRKDNLKPHEWTVERYLMGIPENGK